MALELNDIVGKLVQTAPPGELSGVKKDLNTILSNDNSKTVDTSIEDYINQTGAIFSSQYIASHLNKHPGSTKYIDHIGKQLFNIDISSGKVVDVEEYDSQVQYPSYFDDLVELLESYGQDHYPSQYAYTIIPNNETNEVKVLIIGQKLNPENYYTGQWSSIYTINGTSITGEIKVDIHYYEEGNVRLNFNDKADDTLKSTDSQSIVNFINHTENKASLKIIDNFNNLNQKYFKNLRRLLPVTRAKINWGNAIGNYRLGSDVVNKQ